MSKVTLQVKIMALEKSGFNKICMESNRPRTDVLVEAFVMFKKKYSRKKRYELKHADIDMVNAEIIPFRVSEEVVADLEALAHAFGHKRGHILREVVCEYVEYHK